MYILGIDTATANGGIAIVDEHEIISSVSFSELPMKQHSEALLPSLQNMLAVTELKLTDMSAVAVAAGPGSFTGLRIGIATAKAFAHALELPLISVSSLEATAKAIGENGLVCPLFDARKNEVYAALFRNGERILPDMALSVAALCERILEINEPLHCGGDGFITYQKELTAILGNLLLPSSPESVQTAVAVAKLGKEKFITGDTVTAEELKPVYLRVSEAEAKKAIHNAQCTMHN